MSVKPHASPVLHAIEYLLGQLDPRYLTTLREFGGLQSYPSRLKDPVPADFSTGSVGIGATAPIWSAIAHRYVAGHFEVPQGGRQVALLGDAELDEGAIWETMVDPVVPRLGEVLWIVDLNRQSLDRIVPDIAAGRHRGDVRGGGLADDHASSTAGGCASCSSATAARRCGGGSTRCPTRSISGCCARPPPSCASGCRAAAAAAETSAADRPSWTTRSCCARSATSAATISSICWTRSREADAVTDRPSVIFAYTIKAWRLATEGHPANHSALLSPAQWEQLAADTGADAADPWATFATGSAEAELCQRRRQRLRREAVTVRRAPTPPTELGRNHVGSSSTQQAFGRFFVDLAHAAPDVAAMS